MGAGWYYMANGWMRKGRRVGPITKLICWNASTKAKFCRIRCCKVPKTKGKVGADEFRRTRDESLASVAS